MYEAKIAGYVLNKMEELKPVWQRIMRMPYTGQAAAREPEKKTKCAGAIANGRQREGNFLQNVVVGAATLACATFGIWRR